MKGLSILVVIFVALGMTAAYAAVPEKPELMGDDISSTVIELTWTVPNDGGSPITRYYLEYREGSTGDYVQAFYAPNANFTGYNHTVRTDVLYEYRVYAENEDGRGEESDTLRISATYGATRDTDEPSATQNTTSNTSAELKKPANLRVESLSRTSLALSWDAPLDYTGPAITGYKIQYRISGGWDTLVENTGTLRTHVHEDLDRTKTHRYKVAAINSEGTVGPYTSEVSKQTDRLVNKPVQLVAMQLSPTSVMLSWLAPTSLPLATSTITGYEIIEVFENGVEKGTDPTVTRGEGTSHTLTGLTAGETYHFVVKAKLSMGSSTDESQKVTITLEENFTPITITSPPGAPTGLTATAESESKIKLSWTAPSDDGNSDITGYKIYSKNGSAPYEVLEATHNSRTYDHPDLKTSATWRYKVVAINAIGSSTNSSEASATTLAAAPEPEPVLTAPSAPTALKATSDLTDKINISWKKPTDDGGSRVTGYKIEAKAFDSKNWEVLSSNVKGTAYEHAGVEQDSTYTYRISAINSVGSSGTQTVTGKTIRDDPTKRVPGFPDPAVDPQSYLDRYTNEPEYKAWFDGLFPDYTIYEVIGVPEPKPDPKDRVPGFPDPAVDPQSYLDRYMNEAEFKAWFDDTYPEYTIYEVVGLSEPKPDPKDRVPGFPDPDQPPQYYIDRYENEPAFKEWFDSTFPEYDIREVVDPDSPIGAAPPEEEQCLPGTTLIDGICVVDITPQQAPDFIDLSSSTIWIGPVVIIGIIIAVIYLRRR